MEVMELAEIKKFFMPSNTRYLNPHAEAVRLRVLWTYDKLPNKARDNEDVKKLYNLAQSYVQEDYIPTALGIINKGLKLDPRYHYFYKMRGDIYYRQSCWTNAIRNYESARATVKFDRRIPGNLVNSFYNKKLSDAYWKRGNYYAESDKHSEALYDFEEVLVLKSRGAPVFKIQDKLLMCLRVLDRYEAYRFHWTKFIKNTDTSRASVLLTHHAEYKIFLREMLAARHILSAALDLDPTNKQAQAHLQVVLTTGHTMVTYAIIWCTYGCYDKALMTVEKGRDCDPYNPGYTLNCKMAGKR
ncbi:tetratricopeptide repeat protein 16-like [Cephus cinctus]|uniref:Tetratricopeptide repeat protein 16-like n=1 Tax=Cephus cinctus TaxID=211228 RepID=A0AAJ7RFI3_CEPCN|nr:tetratricopeptide repeat protein 16-like [Cephus cinctus]